MRIRCKQDSAVHPLDVALGALATAALLGGCSGRHAVEAPRPIASASAATADTNGRPAHEGAGTQSTSEGQTPTGGVSSERSASPDEIRTAWREGVALFQQGDYAGASSQLRTAAEGRPEEPYAHYLLGLALWKSGDLEGAGRSLERAATLDPGSVRTFVNLARVRLQGSDPRGALEAAESALGIEPGSADALHQRGRALAALGRGDEALDTLTRAHQADPGNGYVANTLGYLLIQKGRPREALPFLEIARDKLPQVAFVRNNLGVAYERLGRTAEAFVEYRAAVGAGDSEGKAAASLARLEPLVRQAGTAQGEVSTEDGTHVEHDVPTAQDPSSN